MPNAPKTPNRNVRVEDDLWNQFGTAATAVGSDRAAVLRAFMSWFVHESGARMPKRPAPPADPDSAA